MKISILGTNGFLSTAIAKFAIENGWKLDMYGLRSPVGIDCNFYEVNFINSNVDYNSLSDSDLIVYAIGAGIQSNLKESKTLIYELNVNVPVKISNALRNLDYRGTFVTFGSVFEIGETDKINPFTENDILLSASKAPNDYTVSKRMLSKFVSSYNHDFTHWHFYIPTIYGKGENPLRLIPYVINSIKNNNKLQFTSGTQVRQYVHVSEVPKILKLAIEKKLPSGLYNIEGKETLTVREIVELIHSEFNIEIPENCFGTAERVDVGMKYLALDGTKLFEAIGYQSQITISSSIASY